MQNQKTESYQSVDIESLPELNPQETALIEAIASGKSNSDAYLEAYGASGYSRPALRVAACRKVAAPHIQAHLRALRAVGLANARLTAQDRIEDELAFAQRAEDAGNYGAAGGAHDRVNKLAGLYVEHHEVTINDPADMLRAIAEISPELARQAAASYGIEFKWKVLEHDPAD